MIHDHAHVLTNNKVPGRYQPPTWVIVDRRLNYSNFLRGSSWTWSPWTASSITLPSYLGHRGPGRRGPHTNYSTTVSRAPPIIIELRIDLTHEPQHKLRTKGRPHTPKFQPKLRQATRPGGPHQRGAAHGLDNSPTSQEAKGRQARRQDRRELTKEVVAAPLGEGPLTARRRQRVTAKPA